MLKNCIMADPIKTRGCINPVPYLVHKRWTPDRKTTVFSAAKIYSALYHNVIIDFNKKKDCFR